MIEYGIIKRCLKKDRKAQNQLYKECYDVMMSISWRYTNDKKEAIEFVNAGFLKIIINLKKYDKKTPFEFWMRRVFINEIIDQVRKRNRYQEKFEIRESKKIPELQPDSKLTDLQEEKIEWILSKVKKLPNKTSQVFILFAFDGYKHKEIAKLLKITEGTSQWHYAYAKKQLKQWLSEKQ